MIPCAPPCFLGTPLAPHHCLARPRRAQPERGRGKERRYRLARGPACVRLYTSFAVVLVPSSCTLPRFLRTRALLCVRVLGGSRRPKTQGLLKAAGSLKASPPYHHHHHHLLPAAAATAAAAADVCATRWTQTRAPWWGAPPSRAPASSTAARPRTGPLARRPRARTWAAAAPCSRYPVIDPLQQDSRYPVIDPLVLDRWS